MLTAEDTTTEPASFSCGMQEGPADAPLELHWAWRGVPFALGGAPPSN